MTDLAGIDTVAPAIATPQARSVPRSAASPPRRISRVSLALALSLLAPGLLLGLSAWRSWNAAWHAAEAEVIRTAEGAAEYARRVLDGLLLRADMANELLRGIPDDEIRAREAEFHRRLAAIPLRTGEVGALHLFVHDREARSLVSGTLYPVPPPSRSFLHRDFNSELRRPATAPVHVSRVYLGEEIGRHFFAVSRRRDGTGNGMPPGEFDGVIAVSVDVGAIGRAFQRLALNPADVVGLMRSDGQILVRASRNGITTPEPLPPDSSLVARMGRNEERAVTAGPSLIDGERRVGAIRRVSAWPIYASVARGEAAVLAAWRAEMLPQAALALGCTALLGLLALAVRRRELALVEANALLEGRVAERTADLAARAAEFRATFDESPVGMVQVDPRSGRFLRVNGAYCALTGYAEAELLERMTPLELTHPEDRTEDAARFRSTVTLGTRYRTEKRYTRRDGEVIWVEVSAGLIRDPETGLPLRTIATVQDITERRRAEERLLLLTREVDHRAKNALAVVQAAVRLAPRDDPASFAQAVEGRIAALADAQVVLAESSWRGADLRTLAEGAARTFRVEGATPRIELRGPPVFLAATAAQPLSLALHELATNAVKYGALSVPGGGVRLEWWLDGAAGLLRLRWEEHGGPVAAAPPTRRGFGSRVLDATMADQLGGAVERQWLPTGLVCDIALPRRNVIGGAWEQQRG